MPTDQVDAKKIVTQTHRTILFESFTDRDDSGKRNLAEILDVYNEDQDSEGRDLAIKNFLEVSSFEDFLNKFSPAVYEFVEQDGDRKRFVYTTSPKEGAGARKIQIADHAYFKTLCNLYGAKGGEGAENIANAEFKYTDILEKMLAPKAEAEEIRKLRRKMEMIAEKREQKLKNLENADEEKETLKTLYKQARQKYSSVLPLISLAIEDTKRQLEGLARITEAPTAGGEDAPIVRGALALDENGALEVLPLTSTGGEAAAAMTGESLKELAAGKIQKAIGSDFDKHAENKNSFTRELALKALVPGYANRNNLPASREEAKEVEQRLKNQLAAYNFAYTESKNSFIRYMAELVRKILCVKIFFEHATHTDDSGAEIGKGNLIVTNCKPEELIEDEKVKNAFIELLGTWNRRNDTKIWFGILPGVENAEEGDDFEIDDFEDEDVIDVTPVDVMEKGTPLGSAKRLLKLMDDAKITTIFNFRPSRDTSFAKLSAKKLQEDQERLTSLEDNEHAVFAYPNFTLTNERNVQVDDELITIKAVQIDASYVAAGLLVATQRDSVLKKAGFKDKILPQNVNVRVSLEEDGLASKLLTHFNCELLTSWAPCLKDKIRENQFGFVFCGDQKFTGPKGDPINRSYVYQARTMKRDKKGQYYPVYCTLTKDFIKLYTTLRDIDTNKKIQEFLARDVKAWRDQAKTEPEMINLILQPGEDIQLSEENKNVLSVKFNDIEQPVDIQVDTQ